MSIFCWREKSGGADFHARYLLTDKGGIGIDAGFSAEGGRQKTDMHLMTFQLSHTRRAARALMVEKPIFSSLAQKGIRP